MPRETIHWGQSYQIVPEADKPWYEFETEPYQGQTITADGETVPLPENLVVSRRANLDVYWSRPDELHYPQGEDPEGAVQLLMEFDVVDFQNLVNIFLSEVNDPAANLKTWTIPTQKLSRYQLNKLIKVLKRARDAAYEADE